jgi:hypothetical protein
VGSLIAIGPRAGRTDQGGISGFAIAIGAAAGITGQPAHSIALGKDATPTAPTGLFAVRVNNTSAQEFKTSFTTTATAPTGGIVYLICNIGGTNYRILLQQP